MELSPEWLTGGGLLLEVIAAVVLSQAQGSILKLENWGYSNPNPDVLKRAAKKSRWGWLIFGLGIVAQLAALWF